MAWNPDPKLLPVKSQTVAGWPDCNFVPPPITTPAMIGRHALHLSIGRNLALASASPSLVAALQRNALTTLDALTNSRSGDLRALQDIDDLADQTLVGFAHDMAVGVAGLCMEKAGYVWRDHAKRLLPKSRRRPDYVWATGDPSGGVALSEVKGMATSSKTFGELKRRTAAAFADQIDDWQLDSTIWGEPILAGYAIGVHLPAGRAGGIAVRRSFPVPVTHPGAGGPLAPDELPGDYPDAYREEYREAQPGEYGPPLSVARGHYRAALTFLGAHDAAALLTSEAVPPIDMNGEILFDLVEADGILLAAAPRPAGAERRRNWRLGESVPAMEVGALKFALALANDEETRTSSSRGVLLTAPPILRRGAWQSVEKRPSSLLRALAPDGLALLGPYFRRIYGKASWSLWEGFRLD